MPRTGLVTFHFAHHYGAQLQAYATMAAIRALGSECEIIDYRLPHTIRTNQLFKMTTSVRDLASDAHTALHYPHFKARFDRFEEFVRTEMHLSPGGPFLGFDALEASCPPYDVYVAGSDQIWNPQIFVTGKFDPAFLLAFVKEGRRIAYAPSFGVPTLPEDRAAELREYLTPFSALSAREKQGQMLLKQAAGRESRVVLDPTLLLNGDDWGRLAVPPREKGPYILCYFVSDPGEVAPYAQALSERTGYPILQLAGARRKIPGARELIFDAGPREFLGLFQHAAYVCTNSFHGAAFSLQFRKPFFTSMSPKERSEPTLSRIYSLLDRLGCTGRIVGLDSTAPVDALVDYDAVEEKLAAARADSLGYLKAALEGAPLPQETVHTPTPEKLPQLCRREDCTGCTACAAVCPMDAITMIPDHEGFLRPKIGNTCIMCRKCEKACPIKNPPLVKPGPAAAHAVWNSDEVERVNSSSGGFFSLLARRTLEEGGTVFGAVLDGDNVVRHAAARSEAALASMRGSKYVQSALGETFRQVKSLLDGGTPVLFSGVPCQVDGLLRYLGREYPHLTTCDLVCHGVPSPAVFQAYVAHLEQTHGARVTGVRFKDKSHGWGHPYFTTTFENGGVYTEDFNRTTYGRGFGMQLFLRPACARCKYTSTSRPADFTLADYWGLDPALELPVERDKGISMVLVNSARGEAIFEALAPSFGQVERPLEEAVAGNPRLATPLTANPRRAAFFAAFAARSFDQVEKTYLALPSLPYRAAAKVLTPGMKAKIRKILK